MEGQDGLKSFVASVGERVCRTSTPPHTFHSNTIDVVAALVLRFVDITQGDPALMHERGSIFFANAFLAKWRTRNAADRVTRGCLSAQCASSEAADCVECVVAELLLLSLQSCDRTTVWPRNVQAAVRCDEALFQLVAACTEPHEFCLGSENLAHSVPLPFRVRSDDPELGTWADVEVLAPKEADVLMSMMEHAATGSLVCVGGNRYECAFGESFVFGVNALTNNFGSHSPGVRHAPVEFHRARNGKSAELHQRTGAHFCACVWQGGQARLL
jgi:hypothetical protein